MNRALKCLALVVAVGACGQDRELPPVAQDSLSAAGRRDSVVVIEESYITPFDSLDNIDSPAVYHSGSTHWLLATAKTTDAVLVYDAASGALIRRVGGGGRLVGALDRPNGIVIADSLVLVVERDNARVQGFRLPALTPVGTFGEGVLHKPYGIAVHVCPLLLSPSTRCVHS